MKKFLLSLLGVITCICAQATDYKLVTSASDLEVGANYIIVATSNSTWYAMGAQSGSFRSNITITTPSDNIISITKEAVTPITLCESKDESYPYNLQSDTDLYLYSPGTGNDLEEAKLTTGKDAANAKISIAETGSAATITFNRTGKSGSAFQATIFYNGGSPRFSCYFKKGQQPVYLYKKVTSGEDPKIATSISFEKASYKINLGDTFTAPTPTLKGIPEGATLSWESSNTDVATVDAGNVTPGETTGTTTITASYAGDDTHAAASASYTLKVIDPNATIIDSFGYSDLTFSATTNQYSTFTYISEESGAEYAGFAYRGATNIQIKDQKKDNAVINAGIYVSKAPANYKIAKIVITTATNSTSKAALTVYGSTSDFTSVTESDDQIGSITGVGTLTIDFHDSENAAIYGKSFTAFSIRGNLEGAYQVSSVEVVWEPLQEGDIKANPGLAYAETEVEKTMGDETIIFTNPLTNPHSLPITYSIDPADSSVATVDANGQVTVKAAGTVKIVASFAGNETHKAGSASYTLTVKKAQVAYLVTDASTLKKGDIIIIANQDEAMAISNEEKTDYRAATAITFNSDKSEIHSISNDVMLFKLGVWNEQGKSYWVLYTTNYTTNGALSNGALYCSSGTTSSLNIDTPKNDLYDAVITIDQETGEAKIAFNKGAESCANIVRYDSTSDLFNCYTASNSQEPVYIYKVVDKPATVGTQVSDFTFATKGEKENFNVIELENMFETSTTAENVAIYLDNVLVGTFPVTNGEVDAKFDYIPYLPNAEFTMRPVIKTDAKGNPTQLGPSEPLSFTWPNLDSSDTFGYGLYDEAIFCVNEDSQVAPWILYGQFTFIDLFKKPNLDYYVSVEAVKKDDHSFVYKDAQFAWGNGGFIVDIPNYFTSDKWDETTSHPDITGCTVPKVTFIITPSYEFTYDTKYSSLVTAPAGAPARLTAPAETAIQNVESAPQELTSTLTNSSTVSGVEGVTVDANAPVEFFNLQGVRVDGDLAPGIYIRRQGQAVSKVRIN